MHNFPPKQGRPRRYDLRAASDFSNQDCAYLSAALDELRERVIDQYDDLPQNALVFRPLGTDLSIGALVLHLLWAEVNWIARITGCIVPADIKAQVTPAGKAVPAGELPPATTETASELTVLCQRVRDEVTRPALQALPDIDKVIAEPENVMTPRGVLYHVIWHWTYHSAQIGLIREQWGGDYIWTFGPLGKTGQP